MDKCPIELQITELIRRFGNNPVKCTGKILSITNRIPCPECDKGRIKKIFTKEARILEEDCPSCVDGWITADVNKMYEALRKIQSLKYADREVLVKAIEESETLTEGK